jgi:hypothetical protein
VSDIVFIGAVGRSGTTLLERSIATSPSFVCLGEMVHLWERGLRLDEPCGCGQPFRRCPFWTAVAQRAFGGWDALDLDQVQRWKHTADRNRYIPFLIAPRFGGAAFRTALDGLVGVLDTLYTAIGQQAATDAGAQVVLIDSSKHPSYLFVLRHLTAHRVRLLHVVRDPRGVAHSWSKSVERPEAGDDMEQLGPWRASARWTSHNLLFQLAGLLGVRRKRLTYERFTDDPAELGRVLDQLCGAEPAIAGPLTMPRFVDRTVELGCDHTVSGNPLRFKSGALTIRSDDAWRRSMPPAHRRIVAILTTPLRLGHSR